MKTTLLSTLLLLLSYVSYGQCNLQNISVNLSGIQNNCGDYYFIGNISTSHTINSSCGNFYFTPPLIDQGEIVPAFNLLLNEVNISPNPTLDEVKIELGTPLEGKIQLFNLLGQQLITIDMTHEISQYYLTLIHYRAGTYLVRITTLNQLTITKKIIKL